MSDALVYMGMEPEYAVAMAEHLQRLREGSTAVEDISPGVGRAVGRKTSSPGSVWQKEEYEDFLSRDRYKSYRLVAAFLDAVALQPGTYRSTSTLCDEAGIAATAIRQALGKLTGYMERYIESTQWPFGWAYGADIDPDNIHEYHYRMTAEQAEAWTAARAAAESLRG